jgi:hypothetical protein
MSDLPPEARLWNLVRGALGTRALAVVADLRVADALADGQRSVDDLARETGADADALRRFLRALASDGVFAEEESGVFRNTPASELLRGGWGDFAHLFGCLFYRTAERLSATGEAAFPSAFGTDFWSWLADHPDDRAAFDRAKEQGKQRRVERLAALDWRGDETVVDVGGGNGSLLVGCCAGIRACAESSSTSLRACATRRPSATESRSSRAASSSACLRATCTFSRRSSTTGTTSAQVRSCGRFGRRPGQTGGCS